MNLHLVTRLLVTAILLFTLAVRAAADETYTHLFNGIDLAMERPS
jgi:hypothetical protein